MTKPVVPQPSPLTPQPGQSLEDIEKWRKVTEVSRSLRSAKSGVGWEGYYAEALYRTRPNMHDDPQGHKNWKTMLSDAQCDVLYEAGRQADAREDEKKRIAYRDRYGLTDEESREDWALRDLPPVGGKKVEWDRRRDLRRKQKNAPPRKNEDLSKMTPEEKKEHRRAQNREAKARSREKQKAEQLAAKTSENTPDTASDAQTEEGLQGLPHFGEF